MDDSMINPILLSSSIHLENVELLIKNLEKQTLNIDHFQDILNDHNRQEIITKSFSSNIIPIDDISDDNFLIKSIILTNDGTKIDHNNELKKQPILSTIDQSLINDQDGEFTWDDQYDVRDNYRLTFITDNSKSRRDKHRKINSTYSDDDIVSNVANKMNDWPMRSSFEQTINKPQQQIRSQSNPPSSSFQQQILNNNSSGSSTTSSSATSWRQMKESQRITAEIETKETRPSSPLSLYKIFQQKSNSSSPSAFQLYRQQNDSIIPNYTNEITIKNLKSSQSNPSTDQAIQTSISLDSSSITGTSKSHLNQISIHKSLPDLSFISQYSKELPRSHTTSLLFPTSSSSINIARTIPSPTLIQQQKQDSDRPRTLKSIKRYKNSKHSTEPLGVFYSPQLRKTFAAIPTSTEIKMKLPFSSSPQPRLKSCLKYSSKANSCDMLQDQTSPIQLLLIPEFKNNKNSIKRHCSEADILLSSNILKNSSRENHSEYNLTLINQQDNLTKKSVNFSENISKYLISPCNPTNTFNDKFSLTLHENKERLTKKLPIRYDEMRRCQTDIIVVDPVLHLHSFTDSPPNEFCLQQDNDEENQTEIISNLIDISMNNSSILDDILERINNIIKRLFEIKRSDKIFFLNNESNLQLDSLLKNDLCLAIQNILEHGRKDLKKINLWKIIEISIDQNSSEQIPQVYYQAKQIAQNISSYWLYKFQAFIFELLNKNELINWLYYFTRQKDIIQRYYQYPDALILVAISSTFNLFERIMTQLEKLTSLIFRLTYHIPNNSLINDEQLNTSIINARDWIMTISRRTSKNLTQSIIDNNSNDTFRSTLSKKFNSFFTKNSSVVTTKLPEQRKSPRFLHRSRLSNVFTNSTDKPMISTKTTFQSKIPRLSLNVDKPKSVRYRSTAIPPK